MGKTPLSIIYLIAMILVIVGIDLLFFRDNSLGRLIANIAIVAVFGVVYMLTINKRT